MKFVKRKPITPADIAILLGVELGDPQNSDVNKFSMRRKGDTIEIFMPKEYEDALTKADRDEIKALIEEELGPVDEYDSQK